MGLYMRYIHIHLKSQAQYRASFLFILFGQFLMSSTSLLGLYFIMNRFNRVDGFTMQQVLLCYAVVATAFSIAQCFAEGFQRFSQIISNGEFDRALVRPRGIVFQVSAGNIQFTRLGGLAQSLLVFAYAIPTSGVVWSWDKILTLVLMVVCGTLIFFVLFLISATFTFFTVAGFDVTDMFTHGGKTFGSYPYSIYGQRILKFLTFMVPLALFQYYPFLYLTGVKPEGGYGLLPLAGLLFLIPAYVFWYFGLKRYQSTGS